MTVLSTFLESQLNFLSNDIKKLYKDIDMIYVIARCTTIYDIALTPTVFV